MEDPNDDPRDFTHGHDDSNGEGLTPGVETFLCEQTVAQYLLSYSSAIIYNTQMDCNNYSIAVSPNVDPKFHAQLQEVRIWHGNSFSFQIHTGPGLRDSPERPPTMS
ncbi:hypothetical protein H0H93_016738, partial [Arthromyces matolae]